MVYGYFASTFLFGGLFGYCWSRIRRDYNQRTSELLMIAMFFLLLSLRFRQGL